MRECVAAIQSNAATLKLLKMQTLHIHTNAAAVWKKKKNWKNMVAEKLELAARKMHEYRIRIEQ